MTPSDKTADIVTELRAVRDVRKMDTRLPQRAADEIEQLRSIVRDHRKLIGMNPPDTDPNDPLFVEGLKP